MAINRAVVYRGIKDLQVENLAFPKLETPTGRPTHHGVILKVLVTNICGSDQHIYRGRFEVPVGSVLGHEITGEVLEVGRDVEFLKAGDLVSVPFNVACGRCRNCKERHTDICETVNPAGPVGAYGFNLGGWAGGQSEYVMVPYADFNLLKFPDKDQARKKILNLAFVSDILPTAYHGCVSAGVGPGSTVYVGGAGPVGRCAAAASQLLGAACVIVGDTNKARLELVKKAGFQTVDLSLDTPIPDQVAAILGVPEVDCGVDCVGFEAHGHAAKTGQDAPAQVLNDLLQITRAGGGIGIPGVYVGTDPGGANADARHGTLAMNFGQAWIKSLSFVTGMAPIMKYNRQLMQAILWDRIDLSHILNVEIIPLADAPRAYAEFDAGASKKFVIDPHGSLLPK